MTDNKIIEGLDCCRIENCHECPYREYYDCRGTLVQDTFNLINRQNAEIERLKDDIDGSCIFLEEHRKISKQEHENQMKKLNQIQEQIPLAIARERTEAIKEFAKRLLDKYDIWTDSDVTEYQYVAELVNNLVKEMTGEKSNEM